MAERSLPQIGSQGQVIDTATVNAVIKDSISKLQSSIRQGLRLNREAITGTTNAIVSIQDTLARAFNINEQMLALEKEKMRLDAERQIEESRKKDKDKEKKPSAFIKKLQGGLFDVLKKVFTGAALVSAVFLVVKNWETIKKTFEDIKPYLIKLKDIVVDFAEVALPFIAENFENIAKFILGAFVVSKIPFAASLLKKGLTALGSNLLALGKTLIVSAGKLLLAGGKMILSATGKFIGALTKVLWNMTKSSIPLAKAAGAGLLSNAKKLASAMIAVGSNILGSSKELLRGAGGKILSAARALGAAMIAMQGAMAGVLASLGPALVVAAPFIAIGAAVALALKGLYDAFVSAKQTFDETGSIWLAIEEGISQFIGTIIGFPIKLLKDAVAWVARKLGFEQFADDLGSFDPVKGIKEAFRSLMRFIYDPTTGEIFGIDFTNLLELPEFKMPDFSFPEIDLNFPNPFEGIGDSIRNLDFSPLNFGRVLGFNLDIGDKVKSLLGSLFGVDIPPPPPVEGAQSTNKAATSGAEVDTRSRNTTGAGTTNYYNMSPTTATNVNQSTSVNNTTVAPVSPRRFGRSQAAYSRYNDPTMVYN